MLCQDPIYRPQGPKTCRSSARWQNPTIRPSLGGALDREQRSQRPRGRQGRPGRRRVKSAHAVRALPLHAQGTQDERATRRWPWQRQKKCKTKDISPNAYLGSDRELTRTNINGGAAVVKDQENLIQITMVASCQDSNAEYTSPNIPPRIYLSQPIPINTD